MKELKYNGPDGPCVLFMLVEKHKKVYENKYSSF